MILRTYDSKLYASFLEAIEQDAVYSLEVNGSFGSTSNEMMDLLRAVCFNSVFSAPVVLVFEGKTFITTFHPDTVQPF